jgi:4-alpha-glucanotransferase
MQDLLGLGNEARMNTPSTLGGNWQWQCRPTGIVMQLQRVFTSSRRLYFRLPAKKRR